tara:strand:+ start:423 stop:587 length:165 start_codon:yes stop_codon:yes gene_type:complete
MKKQKVPRRGDSNKLEKPKIEGSLRYSQQRLGEMHLVPEADQQAYLKLRDLQVQ